MFFMITDEDSSVIDLEAIQEVCDKFGVKENEVHAALLSGDPHDQLAIAYHLIIDNKRIADEAAKAELKDFYIASSPSISNQSTIESVHKHHPERIGPLREKQPLHTMGEKKGTPIKKAKWHLGIRSQSKPNDIMLEVYRAMKALDYEWKVINPFHIRVRNKNKMSGKYVKMSLQLYQVDYKSYLLDFKSLSAEEPEENLDDQGVPQTGTVAPAPVPPPVPVSSKLPPHTHHTMEFFEMCSALIIQLAR